MGLTVIPAKDFDELVNSVSEARRHPFSYSEMLDSHSSTYQDIKKYMKTTNVAKIGEGTARVAYFMPPGSVPSDKSCPSCLKVARNKKGIGQNGAEIKLFDDYGSKYSCFPEMYEWDRRNDFFLFTEVGKPIVDKADNPLVDLPAWAKEWNHALGLDKYKTTKALEKQLSINPDELDETDFLLHTSETADVTTSIVDICQTLHDDEDGYADKMFEHIKSKVSRFKKYDGVLSLMKFAMDGGTEILNFLDFKYNTPNWAIVLRNGVETLLPIDFGFTWDVINTYYR